jgi:hypothetical protein
MNMKMVKKQCTFILEGILKGLAFWVPLFFRLGYVKNIVDFGPPIDCSGRHEDSYGRIGQDETLKAQP